MNWLKRFVRALLRLLYRVEIKGLEHYHAAGKRVLIVANHTSFLDAILLAAYLPDKPTFAIHTKVANKRWLKPFLALAELFPMDPANPLATKALIRYLQQDKRAIIFPEGRITVTGTIMKVYDGPGLVADKAEAEVLPVRIDGAQYTPFSRMRGRVRLRWFPKITLTVLPPRRLTVPQDVRGRYRRQYLGQQLHDLMTEMLFATSHIDRTLFQALLDARRIHGSGHVIVDDVQRRPLTYRRLIAGSLLLGRLLNKRCAAQRYVGVLMPNAGSTMMTLFGLSAYHYVPAMLNYSLGAQALRKACETAQLQTIVTSKLFVRAAKLSETLKQLPDTIQIIYLEDLTRDLGRMDRVLALVRSVFAAGAYRRVRHGQTPDEAAVVLFTSGSEGAAKGVLLSHRNLLANIAQLSARLDFTAQDVILNALPLFHSFGLTSAGLLPILSGIKVFFYPSPLHYRIVPEVAYDINATLLFGTNTFLAGYARFAHPYDFYSVRYIFAGAEKLQESTRRLYADKFGVRIFEGYGATETSPVLATNTPMQNKIGTVGRLLPGIKHQVRSVPGVEKGGRLFVSGPNVMLGYFMPEQPGVLVQPETEMGRDWYDTGDIVHIDRDGYVSLLGRAKRFAKIGGEMISLTAVEQLINQVWPDHTHAVVSRPDSVKGEQLVCYSDCPEAHRQSLAQAAREQGVSELMIPKRIEILRQLPLLGSGKVDYTELQRLTLQNEVESVHAD